MKLIYNSWILKLHVLLKKCYGAGVVVQQVGQLSCMQLTRV